MIKSAVEQSVSSIKIYLNQQETSPGTLQLSSSQVPAIFVDKRLNRMVWLSGPMLARNLGDKRNAYQILLNSSVLEVGIRWDCGIGCSWSTQHRCTANTWIMTQQPPRVDQRGRPLNSGSCWFALCIPSGEFLQWCPLRVGECLCPLPARSSTQVANSLYISQDPAAYRQGIGGSKSIWMTSNSHSRMDHSMCVNRLTNLF